MTRFIDTLPAPARVETKKLVVLSAPRSGTHGIYQAVKKLGYKPYHMVEVLSAGPNAMQIMLDGFDAEKYHKGKLYGREEFDKWFADFDVIITTPFFMPQSIVKAYPDAKFLLTERDPERWAESFLNTIGEINEMSQAFPMSAIKYVDGFASSMFPFGKRMLDYYMNGFGRTEEGRRHLVENYKNYLEEVKRIVPPEKLKVCRLENGFGWEEICSYLDVPVPALEWPSLNTPEDFKGMMGPKIRKAFVKGLAIMSSVAVSLVAVGFVYFRKGRIPLPV